MATAAELNDERPQSPDQDGNYIGAAAIDLGTTFSGFAFSLKSNINSIVMYKDWGTEAAIPQAFKTPTCVLLKNEKFHSFGYAARAKYFGRLSEEDDDDDDNEGKKGDDKDCYELYEHFKMQLYNDQNLTRNKCVKSKDGKHSCSIMKLITMSLKFLKDKALEQMNQQTGSDLTAAELKWVVTVPAIWSDAAKQFMEEASKEAGLIDDRDPSKFTLALEPEAASIKCKEADVLCRSASGTEFQMPVGTNYLVVDAGGGTLDMTAQKILPNDQMDVLCCANGGPLGGLRVNENIDALLIRTFGEDVMDTYKSNYLADYMEMMNNIEVKKKSVSQVAGTNFNLPLSYSLSSSVSDHYPGKKVNNCIKPDMVEKGVRIGNGFVRFPHALILAAITKVTECIVEEVEDVLQRSELVNVTHIIMVGGFSESKVLQESMREKFDHTYKVVTPENAGTAVLQGAVLYGHKPSVIKARTSPNTYAVEFWPPFDPTKHPTSRRVETDDGPCVKGAVYTLVKKGDVIHRDETRSYFVSPVYARQPTIPVKLFRSKEADVTYSDDYGIKQVANCAVTLPGIGLDRTAEVKFKFGETQVKIEGRDLRGGDVVKTVYSFLADE